MRNVRVTDVPDPSDPEWKDNKKHKWIAVYLDSYDAHIYDVELLEKAWKNKVSSFAYCHFYASVFLSRPDVHCFRFSSFSFLGTAHTYYSLWIPGYLLHSLASSET